MGVADRIDHPLPSPQEAGVPGSGGRTFNDDLDGFDVCGVHIWSAFEAVPTNTGALAGIAIARVVRSRPGDGIIAVIGVDVKLTAVDAPVEGIRVEPHTNRRALVDHIRLDHRILDAGEIVVLTGLDHTTVEVECGRESGTGESEHGNAERY